MIDAYKHLRKKGLTYKEKKEIVKELKRKALKNIYTPDFNLVSSQAVCFDNNISSLDNSIDISSYHSAVALVLKVVLLKYLLQNSAEYEKFIKFLDESRKEINEAKK